MVVKGNRGAGRKKGDETLKVAGAKGRDEEIINFTFRIRQADSDWLSRYARANETNKAKVLRELIIALRDGVHTMSTDFSGYRSVPIKGGLVVVVPKGRDLGESLQLALKTVKVLELK